MSTLKCYYTNHALKELFVGFVASSTTAVFYRHFITVHLLQVGCIVFNFAVQYSAIVTQLNVSVDVKIAN